MRLGIEKPILKVMHIDNVDCLAVTVTGGIRQNNKLTLTTKGSAHFNRILIEFPYDNQAKSFFHKLILDDRIILKNKDYIENIECWTE